MSNTKLSISAQCHAFVSNFKARDRFTARDVAKGLGMQGIPGSVSGPLSHMAKRGGLKVTGKVGTTSAQIYRVVPSVIGSLQPHKNRTVSVTAQVTNPTPAPELPVVATVAPAKVRKNRLAAKPIAKVPAKIVAAPAPQVASPTTDAHTPGNLSLVLVDLMDRIKADVTTTVAQLRLAKVPTEALLKEIAKRSAK